MIYKVFWPLNVFSMVKKLHPDISVDCKDPVTDLVYLVQECSIFRPEHQSRCREEAHSHFACRETCRAVGEHFRKPRQQVRKLLCALNWRRLTMARLPSPAHV